MSNSELKAGSMAQPLEGLKKGRDDYLSWIVNPVYRYS